ncbi:ABC transporter ATP-binding protein [Methylobacterium nonmethylotrophicum]|uniref:ABC transporter ATP-binding protein n=1 Tax=Methylobacterium nonmethylotrophicum TaxID=1141884 RepID=A0A4Z0NG92_9HYPH|nr:ABC transporter ATP-binding protein [Methylobacterium nonmethylotrophicum]TGD95289.1 ABC transporter ATP-binding protein [Methylobacterium nonmethylotrophicum]
MSLPDLSDPGFLTITGAEKRYGASAVLGGVDLAVGSGEFVSLLGPSGCGKTTLLRIVAGLVAPDRGRVVLDGRDITRSPPHRRDVGVVFQNYALFPHLTVAENVAFGLKAKGHPKSEIPAAVARFLALVQMAPFADRRAQALSGGQQQRVAVARALAVRPKLLLLDEPFSALDRKLREAMQIDLKRLLRELGITALFVTHDQDEALTMSDRIAVMNRGAIEQLADPVTLYRRPATAFALGFVGLSSRLPGTVREEGDGMLRVETPLGTLRAPGRFRPGSPVLLGVRPERIRVSGDGPNTVEAALVEVAFQGARAHLFFAGPDGERTLMAETPEIPAGAAPGARLRLSWAVEDTLVFPAEPAPQREAA